MSDAKSTRQESIRRAALLYHEFPKPGKLEIRATKPMANGRDLALAYSPGVAEACLEIEKDPSRADRYTARGNLVAVVTNGTAVLGAGRVTGYFCPAAPTGATAQPTRPVGWLMRAP